ncbi:MAG: hypothetical protein HQK76_09075 [Desulfobacterales bacterium]|nr:hypothetical protein [Desulfobacterales bacterium]
MTISDIDNEKFIRLKKMIQSFQAERLSSTYKDLKAMIEYDLLGKFFFEKLYAPEDFSFRDNSIKKLHRLLHGVINTKMVSAVGMVIELHELSDELDNKIVQIMMDNKINDLDLDIYKKVYRLLNNYDQRLYQINLCINAVKSVHRMSKMWIIKASLVTVRTASHFLGMGKIMDFLYEGYQAFYKVNNIDYFVDTIRSREIAWHNQIWAEAEILLKAN